MSKHESSDESTSECNSSAPFFNRTSSDHTACNETSTSFENLRETEKELLLECNTRAYLDGTYFLPDLSKSSSTGKIKAICQLCSKEKKDHTISGSLRSSSNFVSHIKKAHKREIDEYRRYAAEKSKRIKLANEDYKASCRFSQAKFEENVIGYILESMAPLNTVESPAFRKIFDDMRIKRGNKELKHLSARTVGRKVAEAYEEKISTIKDELAKKRFICTTADIWSSPTRRFLGMTVHWVDEYDFTRKSFALACRRFDGSHTHDRVAEMIQNIHDSFNIASDKLIATVTDNGTNLVKAFSEFGLKGDVFFQDDAESTKDLNDELDCSDHAEHLTFGVDDKDPHLPQHFRCACHTLSLVVTTDALKGIKSCAKLEEAYNEMITRCATLWKLTKSPKKREILVGVLGEALKKPVITRWNSLYESLSQIMTLKEKIIANEMGISDNLRILDFQFMEEFLRCSLPIAQGIDILQGEMKCHFGYLIPTLVSIQNKLKNLQKENTVWCDQLINAMVEGLARRFKNVFDVTGEGRIAAVAAASHPGFKLKWMNCLSQAAQNNALLALKEALKSTQERACEDTIELEEHSFFDFSCEGNIQIAPVFGTNNKEAVYQQFLADKRTDLHLLNSYPLLKEIFLKFNTPLPSSAAVERLFSHATMFNLPKYNRLTDGNFELRVLMQSNSSISSN